MSTGEDVWIKQNATEFRNTIRKVSWKCRQFYFLQLKDFFGRFDNGIRSTVTEAGLRTISNGDPFCTCVHASPIRWLPRVSEAPVIYERGLTWSRKPGLPCSVRVPFQIIIQRWVKSRYWWSVQTRFVLDNSLILNKLILSPSILTRSCQARRAYSQRDPGWCC